MYWSNFPVLASLFALMAGATCRPDGGPAGSTGAAKDSGADRTVDPSAGDMPPGVADAGDQRDALAGGMPDVAGDDRFVAADTPTVAGPDASAGHCPYVFCEGFESDQPGQAPDPARWAQDVGPDVVDGTQPHGGRLALHVPPNTGGTCADVPGSPVKLCSTARFIRISDAIPTAVRQRFYGRVWFYVGRQPTEGHGQDYHWTLLEAGAGTSYYGGLAVRLGGHLDGRGVNWLRFHLETQMLSDPNHETGLSDLQAVIKPRTWTCIEWFYDGPASEAMFWMDGQERPALHWKGPTAGRPQWTFPTEWKSIAFGWREYQATQTPWEVFVDDIALDSKRIGCGV